MGVQSPVPPFHILVGPHRSLKGGPAVRLAAFTLNPSLLNIVEKTWKLLGGCRASGLQMGEGWPNVCGWKVR